MSLFGGVIYQANIQNIKYVRVKSILYIYFESCYKYITISEN